MEKQFYSEAELEEFRQVILKKLDVVKNDIESLKSMCLNKNSGEDTFHVFKAWEDPQEVLSLEQNQLEINRLLRLHSQLENALTRIQFKTYGVCCKTGKLIPKERLLAVPTTTKIIEMKV
jgi:RNA polymerase-binding transcription factor DksA